MSIWGLTQTDFQHCFDNDITAMKVFFAGAAVAAAVMIVAQSYFKRENAEQSYKSTFKAVGAATILGCCASFYVAYRSTPIEVESDNALKFLTLAIFASALGSLKNKEGAALGLLTFGGGVWPVMGAAPLYFVGLYGAFTGATYFVGR